MIRKIAGALIITTFFVVIFVLMIRDTGVKVALITFGASIVSALILTIGVVLIFWNGR